MLDKIKKLNWVKVLATFLCMLSIVYIVRFPRNHGSYLPFVVGVGLFVLEYLKNKENKGKVEKVLYRINQGIFIYFTITFTIFCFDILSNRNIDEAYEYDSIVVLGAGLNGGRNVSRTLRYRLDKAIELYELNPVPIVVSGGQGKDEDVSEAFAMKEYLIAQGISEEDVYMEDKSTSTEENFDFSKDVLDGIFTEDYEIVFTSNDFHISRAEKFMEDSGLVGYGVGGPSDISMIPSNYLREYLVTHIYFFTKLVN